jgi:hypothetical protein
MSSDDLVAVHQDATFEAPPVLLYAFAGFVDAGGGVRLAADHILSTCDHTLVATFDIDELLDYRARRPRMTYVVDRFTSVDMPRICLYQVRDAAGQGFLLLVGPEPDYQWQRFLRAVRALAARFEVRLAVGLSAIPWPAPHTRPIGVTLHGSETELVAGRSNVIGEIEVPGHIGALLEFELGQQEVPSVGVTVQVPHYLSQFDYPASAIALLDSAAALAGLHLPSEGLQPAAQRAEREVAEQIAGNDEFATVVAALEQQYDQMAQIRSAAADLAVPSGDEIAAQVERFLADLDQDGSR